MDPQADLISRARTGDRSAQGELVVAMKDLVYNLSIRMLGNPTDAEDATQEILMKVVGRLDSFRGDSSFKTWTYRVASNHLLTTRKRAAELRVTSFEDLGDKLASNLAAGDAPLDDKLLVLEAKRICTSMMLICLDRDHRLAYILGEILELSSEDGAAVLEIEPDAFRKRVSRARTRVAEFMSASCGLVDEARACRCGKQAAHGVRVGLIDPTCLVWTSRAVHPEVQQARVDGIDHLLRAAAVFRGHPSYIAPDAVVAGLKQALAVVE